MNAPPLLLLIDPPSAGQLNMARDEALLQAVGDGSHPPTLRLYAWDPPTISLGYFQSLDDLRKQPAPIRDLALVRRTTGGGAILHDLELTYSLTVPVDHPWLAPNATNLYRVAHAAILTAVGSPARLAGPCGAPGSCADPATSHQTHRSGPFFCFARRHELDVVVPDSRDPSGFAKLAGSAQRRTRKAVLQHGSLILDSRYPQQPCATWSALGGPADFEDAAARLTSAFESTTGTRFTRAELPADLSQKTDELLQKYASDLWTLGCGPIRDKRT